MGSAHASEASQAADTSLPVVIEVLPPTLGIYVSCPDAPTVEVTPQYPYIKAPSGSVCGVEAWQVLGRSGELWLGAAWPLFSVETKRLVLSKSAVNHYLRATMAFKRARFWTNVSYPS